MIVGYAQLRLYDYPYHDSKADPLKANKNPKPAIVTQEVKVGHREHGQRSVRDHSSNGSERIDFLPNKSIDINKHCLKCK